MGIIMTKIFKHFLTILITCFISFNSSAYDFKEIKNSKFLVELCSNWGSESKNLIAENSNEDELINRWKYIYEGVCTVPETKRERYQIFAALNTENNRVESILLGDPREYSFFVSYIFTSPLNLEIKQNQARSRGSTKFLLMSLKSHILGNKQRYPKIDKIELIARPGSEKFYEHIGFKRQNPQSDTFLLYFGVWGLTGQP
jgi:hypothetical protein